MWVWMGLICLCLIHLFFFTAKASCKATSTRKPNIANIFFLKKQNKTTQNKMFLYNMQKTSQFFLEVTWAWTKDLCLKRTVTNDTGIWNRLWLILNLFFHCTVIYLYIYCIYSLNCLWQQIKSDIHVKFVLIKLYKIAYYEKILQLHRYSSQKTDRWTEVWRLSCISLWASHSHSCISTAHWKQEIPWSKR